MTRKDAPIAAARAAGALVVELGDVDGDGVADRALGRPRAQTETRRGGCVLVVSGADGRTLYELWGRSAGERFGWSVCGLGDVDHDGCQDFAVGAPLADENGANSGSVYVFSGRDGRVLLALHGEAPDEQFGHAVAGVGDADGDGTADLVIGAPFARRGGHHAGRVVVCSGRDGAVLVAFDGDRPGLQLGRMVAGVGDVDGDGCNDVAVAGRTSSSVPGTARPALEVHSGRTGLRLDGDAGAGAGAGRSSAPTLAQWRPRQP